MALYTWEAVTKQGAVKRGEREANNEGAVTKYLRSQQLKPIKIAKKIQVNTLGSRLKSIFGGVGEKHIVIFTRQFATMIDAGLPLVQCLSILHKQQEHKLFKSILKELQNDVESGATFADSLKKHPKAFDSLFCSLVAAGEIGGILDTIFLRLSNHLEKVMKLKRIVKGAMVYPVLILIVAIAVIVVLLTWVIPIFEKMFQSFSGAKLPAPTQMVIDMSHWFKSNLIFIIIIVAGAIFAFKQFRSTEKGKLYIDKTLLQLPLFGDLIRKVAVARFCRTLGTLMSSGVPILDGMDIVSRAAGNKVIEAAILGAKEAVSQGRTMSEPIEKSKIFPPMVSQMIEVGESTGALDQMLSKIADFYEDEVDAAVEAITKVIEPAMMVVLGGIIGGLVLTMYLPIFELAGSIQSG